MDPNVTLQTILKLANRVAADYSEEDGNGVDQDDANALAEACEALDTWIRRGGFLPDAWEAGTCGRDAE